MKDKKKKYEKQKEVDQKIADVEQTDQDCREQDSRNQDCREQDSRNQNCREQDSRNQNYIDQNCRDQNHRNHKSEKCTWKRRLLRGILCILLIGTCVGIYLSYVYIVRMKLEPPTALTETNTTPAVYQLGELKTVLSQFDDFFTVAERNNLENTKEYGTYVIPGLKATKTINLDTGNVDMCTSMTPQSIAVTNQYLIVSAYCHTKEHDSVLYMIDKSTHDYVKTVVLPGHPHVGGLAYDTEHGIVWVSGRKKGVSYANSYTLESMMDYSLEETQAPLAFRQMVPLVQLKQNSFMTYRDSHIYAGYFSQTGEGVLYKYALDDEGRLESSKPVESVDEAGIQNDDSEEMKQKAEEEQAAEEEKAMQDALEQAEKELKGVSADSKTSSLASSLISDSKTIAQDSSLGQRLLGDSKSDSENATGTSTDNSGPAGSQESESRDTSSTAGSQESESRDTSSTAGSQESESKDTSSTAGSQESESKDTSSTAGSPESTNIDDSSAAGQQTGTGITDSKTAGTSTSTSTSSTSSTSSVTVTEEEIQKAAEQIVEEEKAAKEKEKIIEEEEDPEDTFNPVDFVSMPSLVQGISFFGSDYLLVAESYGMMESKLRVFKNDTDSTDGYSFTDDKAIVSYTLPDKLECAAVADGKVYLVFEAAAYAYRVRPMYNIDRVLTLQINHDIAVSSKLIQ